MPPLRVEARALWRPASTLSPCGLCSSSESLPPLSSLSGFSDSRACEIPSLPLRAVPPLARRHLSRFLVRSRTLASAQAIWSGVTPRQTAHVVHVARAAFVSAADPRRRSHSFRANSQDPSVSGNPTSAGALERHRDFNSGDGATSPAPRHVVLHQGTPRFRAFPQTFAGQQSYACGPGALDSGREARFQDGRTAPDSSSSRQRAEAKAQGRAPESRCDSGGGLMREAPGKHAGVVAELVGAPGVCTQERNEAALGSGCGRAWSRAGGEGNFAGPHFARDVCREKSDETAGVEQDSHGQLSSFSSIGMALRRAEKAARAIDVLQPRAASAAEVAEVARMCADAQTYERASTAAAAGMGDIPEKWRHNKVGVPFSAKITFLRKMASMPEDSVPVEERHVRLFFEDVTGSLLERLSLHQSSQATLFEDMRSAEEDTAFQRMSEDLSRSLLIFQESGAGHTSPTVASRRVHKLEASLEELQARNVAMRNDFVTAMWAFCILGLRGHLKTLGPAYASLMHCRLEQRGAAVQGRRESAARESRETFAERTLTPEDVECACGVLGYLRRARLSEGVEAILAILTRENGACLAGLTADELSQLLYETRPNHPSGGCASNSTRKRRDVLLNQLSLHALKGLPGPSPVHAARAASSVVDLQTPNREEQARVRELVLQALAEKPEVLRDALVGAVPVLRLLIERREKKERGSEARTEAPGSSLSLEQERALLATTLEVLNQNADCLLPLELLALVRPSCSASARTSANSPHTPLSPLSPLSSLSSSGEGDSLWWSREGISRERDAEEGRSAAESLLGSLPISEEEKHALKKRILAELSVPKNLSTIATRDLLDVLSDSDTMAVLRENKEILESLLRAAIGRTLELSIPFNLRVALRFFLLQKELPFSVPKFSEIFSACALKSAAAAEALLDENREDKTPGSARATADLVLGLSEIEEACDLLEQLDAMNDLAPVAFARHLLLQVPPSSHFSSDGHQGAAPTEETHEHRHCDVTSVGCGEDRLKAQKLGSWLRVAVRVLFLTVDTHGHLEAFNATVRNRLVEAMNVSRVAASLADPLADPLAALSGDERVQCLWSLCVLDSHLVDEQFPACEKALLHPLEAAGNATAPQMDLLQTRSAFLVQHLAETLESELPTYRGDALCPETQRLLTESVAALDGFHAAEKGKKGVFRLVGFTRERDRMAREIAAEMKELGVEAAAAYLESLPDGPQPDLRLSLPPARRCADKLGQRSGLLLLPLTQTSFSSVASRAASRDQPAFDRNSESAAENRSSVWKQPGRRRLSATLQDLWAANRRKKLELDGWRVQEVAAEEWNAVRGDPARRRRLLQQKLEGFVTSVPTVDAGGAN
ncbi:hypothetical protein TGFOU_223270 [Toxoplasma gondii FOU]|uniref:Uncharacterized protein n=3 Tax=Toxoplasma gondii TaxID=5811 RepID=A0A086LB48_TOXGO|nr:hypothetical protein TGFOU_223270 [Toxoplasma gondii FOU]PUA91471.1 hypothetical protein TGBR9_223270 [Toxoplasma gondii TgCATBr9]RQX68330.1 hypothetical protein TGCAST_223270 [Toxoplasma gondii CAST]